VPPAASTPDLTLSATVGEDVSERIRENERGELTLGNMAVEGVDDDGNPWRRHFVDSELGEKMLERTLGTREYLYRVCLSVELRQRPCDWLISLMTEPGVIFRTFHPRSTANVSNQRKNLPHPPCDSRILRPSTVHKPHF